MPEIVEVYQFGFSKRAMRHCEMCGDTLSSKNVRNTTKHKNLCKKCCNQMNGIFREDNRRAQLTHVSVKPENALELLGEAALGENLLLILLKKRVGNLKAVS